MILNLWEFKSDRILGKRKSSSNDTNPSNDYQTVYDTQLQNCNI